MNGSIAVRKDGKNDKRRKRRASRGYNVCQVRSHSSMCSDRVKRNLVDTIPRIISVSDTFSFLVKETCLRFLSTCPPRYHIKFEFTSKFRLLRLKNLLIKASANRGNDKEPSMKE